MTARCALAAANIRYIYNFKDIAIGQSPDDIRYFGFDNTIRVPLNRRSQLAVNLADRNELTTSTRDM